MIHVSRRAGAAVAAVCVAGAGLFATSSTAAEDRYRTVAAARGDVERTVSYDGTIAASNRSDLGFATDGTVRKVRFEVGDKVEAGDVLATLDASDLKAAVIDAEAAVAEAEAYLDDVEDGQIDTVTRAAGGGQNPTASSATDAGTVTSALYTGQASARTTFAATTPAATSSELTSALAELARQQDAVKSAQSEAATAIRAARTALAAQQEACEQDDATTAISQECRDALAAVQRAQDVVTQRQDTLQSALETLGATLADAVDQLAKDAAGSTGGSDEEGRTTTDPDRESGPQVGGDEQATPGGADRDQAGGDRTDANGSGAGDGAAGSSGTSATVADLASAQADVDTAEAALASAEAELAAATLTAPFDGTVMAVDVAPGDAVSSADAAFVLIGEGDTTATASVPVDDVAAIDIGQAATVTHGSTTAASGTVSAVGLAPESTDGESSVTTYRVTVTLDGDLAAPEGSAAVVAIVTGTASDVVTVPTSAVTRRTTTQGSVLVLVDGDVERRQVTLGAMAATRSAITEGVKDGEQVVVADMEAALPSSDTASTRSLTGGGRGGPPAGPGTAAPR